MKNLIKKFIPSFLLDWYHWLLAFLSAVLYQFPSRKLIVIGITGTGGKSTAVELTHQVLKEAGYKVASLSSIRFKIGDKEEPNLFKMTMPGRGYIQKFLRKAVNAGSKYAIIEVTSEGILQHRHKFIDFDTAVFTNLSQEHIERHGSFERYREAKGELFKAAKKNHIINLDDKNAGYFLQFPADKKYGFRIGGGQTSASSFSVFKNLKIIEVQNYQLFSAGSKFFINNTEFNLNLLGKFNVYNALATICVALSQGIDLEICKRALEKIKGISGRMEIVISEPFTVIVDYAHTPDALEKVYKTIKDTRYPAGKIQNTKMVCVLGACGGGRDKWKRPEFGKIAAKYCDRIILTNEDPYDEPPAEILNQIEKGISINQLNHPARNASHSDAGGHKSAVYKILDRREAIRKALRLAKAGDIVIITGKGSEPWMCVANGKKIPWDDRKIVKEEFQYDF